MNRYSTTSFQENVTNIYKLTCTYYSNLVSTFIYIILIVVNYKM